jgi:hypothetical protein
MPPGRPKKLDSAKQQQICALITVGCTRRTAAIHTGVSCTAIRNLARRDREFADRLQRAEMLRQATALRHIHNAAAKNWRAAAWLLERTFPDDYALRRPRWLSYDEASHMIRDTFETLSQYITDRESRQEAYDRVTNILNRNRRNACAANDPYPRRFHRCKIIDEDPSPQHTPLDDATTSEFNQSTAHLPDQTREEDAQPDWCI